MVDVTEGEGLRERLGVTEMVGVTEGEGLSEVLGVTLGVTEMVGVTEGEGLSETLGVMLGVTDMVGILGVTLGVTEMVGVTEGEGLSEMLGVTLGVTEMVGVTEGEGLSEMLGVTLGVTEMVGVTEGDGLSDDEGEGLVVGAILAAEVVVEAEEEADVDVDVDLTWNGYTHNATRGGADSPEGETLGDSEGVDERVANGEVLGVVEGARLADGEMLVVPVGLGVGLEVDDAVGVLETVGLEEGLEPKEGDDVEETEGKAVGDGERDGNGDTKAGEGDGEAPSDGKADPEGEGKGEREPDADSVGLAEAEKPGDREGVADLDGAADDEGLREGNGVMKGTDGVAEAKPGEGEPVCEGEREITGDAERIPTGDLEGEREGNVLMSAKPRLKALRVSCWRHTPASQAPRARRHSPAGSERRRAKMTAANAEFTLQESHVEKGRYHLSAHASRLYVELLARLFVVAVDDVHGAPQDVVHVAAGAKLQRFGGRSGHGVPCSEECCSQWCGSKGPSAMDGAWAADGVNHTANRTRPATAVRSNGATVDEITFRATLANGAEVAIAYVLSPDSAFTQPWGEIAVTVPRNHLKYTFNARRWPFAGAAHRLRLAMSLASHPLVGSADRVDDAAAATSSLSLHVANSTADVSVGLYGFALVYSAQEADDSLTAPTGAHRSSNVTASLSADFGSILVDFPSFDAATEVLS
ncbi:uncharacterized protein ACA1_363080, partial [Acanthamoeba castellanii str. Neff]